MNYTQKYCLASLLKPLVVGSEFGMDDWPLDITLADVFAVDLSLQLCLQLAAIFTEQSPVMAIAGQDATLTKTRVVLLDKTEPLHDLHIRTINCLTANGAIFNNPEFVGEGYIPHCTIQKTGRLEVGDEVAITTITLIDMFPDGNWRRRKVLQNPL